MKSEKMKRRLEEYRALMRNLYESIRSLKEELECKGSEPHLSIAKGQVQAAINDLKGALNKDSLRALMPDKIDEIVNSALKDLLFLEQEMILGAQDRDLKEILEKEKVVEKIEERVMQVEEILNEISAEESLKGRSNKYMRGYF